MAKSYAVAVDPSGRLLWKRNDIGGDHVIVILTRTVPASHLAFLRERGVSYLIAGNDHIDFPAALAKLKSRFGINRLAVEGRGNDKCFSPSCGTDRRTEPPSLPGRRRPVRYHITVRNPESGPWPEGHIAHAFIGSPPARRRSWAALSRTEVVGPPSMSALRSKSARPTPLVFLPAMPIPPDSR